MHPADREIVVKSAFHHYERHDRRRPGRRNNIAPVLIPLLRGRAEAEDHPDQFSTRAVLILVAAIRIRSRPPGPISAASLKRAMCSLSALVSVNSISPRMPMRTMAKAAIPPGSTWAIASPTRVPRRIGPDCCLKVKVSSKPTSRPPARRSGLRNDNIASHRPDLSVRDYCCIYELNRRAAQISSCRPRLFKSSPGPP